MTFALCTGNNTPNKTLAPYSLPYLRIPLCENMDELPVDRELSTAGLRHLHVGTVEPEVGRVMPVHINWIRPKAILQFFINYTVSEYFSESRDRFLTHGHKINKRRTVSKDHHFASFFQTKPSFSTLCLPGPGCLLCSYQERL
jgi:hypothetical protein